MKTKKIFLLLSLITLLANCSKGEQKTSAKLNLKLSGITNLVSGTGSGGAILFGKSSTGEQFGKIITGADISLDLLNGDWSFYTVMWDKTFGSNFSDVAYCGKSINKLSGTAVNINLNLSNANCADNDFSGGKHYSKDIPNVGLKNTFASLYIEDCDDLSRSGKITCNISNQGNALSYRLNFKSYNKSASGAPVFSSEVLKSQCLSFTNAHETGLNVNFPTSNSAMPFIVSVEMYLGSSDCSLTVPETKGMYTHIFDQGLAIQGANDKMIMSEGTICAPKASITEGGCLNFLGTFTPNGCSAPETITKFIESAECLASPVLTTTKSIKHMFSIPKDLFCFADISNYGLSGSDLFPAGNGSRIRPFKICNEWQINQIGEMGSSPLMSTYHYKLLNDLDMNKTDFGAFPKPLCTREAGSIVGEHHNFNPLDGLFDSSCTKSNDSASFSGSFNGNLKTISHARISAEGVSEVGFVRKLESGFISNLRFKNLQVEGLSELGGIAGVVDATKSVSINNIRIDGLEIQSRGNSSLANITGNNIGSVAGIISKNAQSVSINSALITDAEIYGNNNVGGLVGHNQAIINLSKFSGALKVFGPHMSESFTGGLIAVNNGGEVLGSLSEGLIISNSNYVGGIIGKSITGKIESAYSTMYIDSRSNPTSKIGGIIGFNDNGGYNNIFFDGVIEEYDRNTADVNPISNGNISNITTNNCFFTGEQFNFYINPVSDCIPVPRPILFSTPITFSHPPWKKYTNSVPRFQWENGTRICLDEDNNTSISNQKNVLKKGFSALNPIVICHPSQFTQLSSLTINDFAVLGENLNLSQLDSTKMVSNFLGNFDGKNNGIYGLKFNSVDLDSLGMGLFKSNSGTIANLNLVGNKIFRELSSNKSGILTGVNSGTIKNIRFVSNTIVGVNNVGLVAGENRGLIEKIKIRGNEIRGYSSIGGVAGSNVVSLNNVSGVIRKVSVETNIFSPSDNLEYTGGITGVNTGIIDQAEFNGIISFYSSTPQNEAFIGGIAGYNQGSISNVMTSSRSQISISSSSLVGGLVGKNDGNISNSLALGRVLFTTVSSLPSASFSATVGQSSGTINNLYFLEKNLGTQKMINPTVTNCVAGIVTYTSSVFLNPDSPDLYFSSSNGFYNGNSLMTLSSVVPTSAFAMNVGDCGFGQNFSFVKSFGPPGMSAASFSIPSNFTAFNMAYPGHLEENVLEYHKADMYKREPTMDLPIWVLEEGDAYPRLLQVED